MFYFQLRRIDFLQGTFRLSELYLHNNELVELGGALAHLASLQVLMLQNNQLEKLEKVVREFKKMHDLRVLSKEFVTFGRL